MPSKISYFSPAIFKKNITRFAPIWIIYSLLLLVTVPLYIFTYDTTNSTAIELANSFNDTILSFVITPTTIFFALITAVFLFSYLFQSKSAALFHSFPIKRESLFLSNFLSGIVILAIPNTLCLMVSWLVGSAHGYMNTTALLKWYLATLILCFIMFSFAVFISMLTGNVVIMVLLFLILGVVSTGMELIVKHIVSIYLYGLVVDSNLILDKFSPLFYFFSGFVSFDSTMEVSLVTIKWTTLFIYGFVAFISVITSLVLYKFRKIETAGDTITVSWLRPVFKTGVTLCGAFAGAEIFNLATTAYSSTTRIMVVSVALLIFGYLFCNGADMLLKRSVRIWKSNFFPAIGHVGLLLVIIICAQLNVFQFGSQLPAVSEIDHITFEDNGHRFYTTDEKDFINIEKFHQAILDNEAEDQNAYNQIDYSEEGNTSVSPCYYTITYRLKNGKEIARTYSVPINTKEFTTEGTTSFALAELMSEDNFTSKYVFPEDFSISNIITFQIDAATDMDGSAMLNLSSQSASSVYSALLEDLNAGNFSTSSYENLISEDTVGSNYVLYTTIEYPVPEKYLGYYSVGSLYAKKNHTNVNSISLTIDSNCTNTLKALKDLGYDYTTYVESGSMSAISN